MAVSRACLRVGTNTMLDWFCGQDRPHVSTKHHRTHASTDFDSLQKASMMHCIYGHPPQSRPSKFKGGVQNLAVAAVHLIIDSTHAHT